MAQPNVTTDTTTWKFQQSYIERLMDHAALTSAHPDDTLILAGPPRLGSAETPLGNSTEFMARLLPLGVMQSFSVMFQKPTQPVMAIGSGRNFFVSGKSQGNAQIARLVVNGRNLLRALYTSAVQAGLQVDQFDDPAAISKTAKFFINLDSELFYIPIGLGVMFRDKIHQSIGAFYMELCMINSYAIAFNAGQNMILENVSILFDRALPMDLYGAGEGGALKESDLQNDSILGPKPIYPSGPTNDAYGAETM